MSAGSWRDVAAAQRVLCYGTTGSGKSTIAVRLGELLDLPVTLVDEESWLPGWIPVPDEEQDRLMVSRVARDTWVLDTCYGRHRPLVVPRTEVIVALDYPRLVSLGRLVRRTGRRIVTGDRTCNGNIETLRLSLARDSILWWHFRSWRRKRERMRAWYADPAAPPTVLLRHPRDAVELLERLA